MRQTPYDREFLVRLPALCLVRPSIVINRDSSLSICLEATCSTPFPNISNLGWIRQPCLLRTNPRRLNTSEGSPPDGAPACLRNECRASFAPRRGPRRRFNDVTAELTLLSWRSKSKEMPRPKVRCWQQPKPAVDVYGHVPRLMGAEAITLQLP